MLYFSLLFLQMSCIHKGLINKLNISCVAHNCQLGMKNRQFGIIAQDMNATCPMQSLKTLGLLGYYTMFSPKFLVNCFVLC